MIATRKLFDPDKLAPASDPRRPPAERHRDVDYVYSEEIVVAINVALATKRALLLRGDPGSGKSSVARDVARRLGWRYYEAVVGSGTSAEDLLWRVDHVQRIADAQLASGGGERRRGLNDYVQPGVLWWAFDAEQAARRGHVSSVAPSLAAPGEYFGDSQSIAKCPAVVLIDEIDKADPELPNDILVPIGALSFRARLGDVDVTVNAPPKLAPLVFITTNEERDLPHAFVRRCITLKLEQPRGPRLGQIARNHFTTEELDDARLAALTARFEDLVAIAQRQKLRAPSTAEFLDAARALAQLKTEESKSFAEFLAHNQLTWRQVTNAALWKHTHVSPESEPSR